MEKQKELWIECGHTIEVSRIFVCFFVCFIMYLIGKYIFQLYFEQAAAVKTTNRNPHQFNAI